MFSPLNWLLFFIFLVLVIKNKKWKRIFLITAVSIFIIFSIPNLFNFYAKWWQPKPAQLPEKAHYDFAIIAGGFASVDDAGGGYFNSASDRFLQAVKLYHTGIVDHIFIAGGNSKKNDKDFREGTWAKGEMIKMGVPDSVIFVDDKSKDTKGNAVYAKEILDSLHASSPFVLITSAFHLPRAQKLFEKEGLKVLGYPCNYTEGRGPLTTNGWIPDPSVLSSWSKYIKETIGRVIGK